MRLRSWRRTTSITLALAFALGAGAAQADEPKEGEPKEGHDRLAVSYVERPLTLPRYTLAPELGLGISRAEEVTGAGFDVSVRFGITDDVEIGAVVAPVEVTPEVSYTGPKIFTTLRFLHRGPVELGGYFGATLITHGSEAQPYAKPLANVGVVFMPGIPLRVHVGESGRIDLGVYGLIQASPTREGGSGVGLSIPLSVAVDILEPLHVGLSSGALIRRVDQAGESARIPLGIFAGYAIRGPKGPMLDLDPYFQWPDLVTPSPPEAAGGTEVKIIDPSHWQLGLNIGFFLYL